MGWRRIITRIRSARSDSRFLGAENNRNLVGLRVFVGSDVSAYSTLPIKPRWSIHSLVQPQPVGPDSFFDIHIALGVLSVG